MIRPRLLLLVPLLLASASGIAVAGPEKAAAPAARGRAASAVPAKAKVARSTAKPARQVKRAAPCDTPAGKATTASARPAPKPVPVPADPLAPAVAPCATGTP